MYKTLLGWYHGSKGIVCEKLRCVNNKNLKKVINGGKQWGKSYLL